MFNFHQTNNIQYSIRPKINIRFNTELKTLISNFHITMNHHAIFKSSYIKENEWMKINNFSGESFQKLQIIRSRRSRKFTIICFHFFWLLGANEMFCPTKNSNPATYLFVQAFSKHLITVILCKCKLWASGESTENAEVLREDIEQ